MPTSTCLVQSEDQSNLFVCLVLGVCKGMKEWGEREEEIEGEYEEEKREEGVRVSIHTFLIHTCITGFWI